jgi:phospholipase C
MNIPQPEDGITFTGMSDDHHVTYDFTRLGVRYVSTTPYPINYTNISPSVPAFLISPWVPANHLIHDEGTKYADDSAYTHSSILHFLQELWDLEGLNNRVQWAKTFESAFTATGRDNTPQTLSTPTWYGGSGQPEPETFGLLNQDESYYASQ